MSKLTKLDTSLLVGQFQWGATKAELAAVFGISERTVGAVLAAQGVTAEDRFAVKVRGRLVRGPAWGNGRADALLAAIDEPEDQRQFRREFYEDVVRGHRVIPPLTAEDLASMRADEAERERGKKTSTAPTGAHQHTEGDPT